MTVEELRGILLSDWLPEDLIIMDYNDNVIRDVNLVIAKDGSITELRLGMGKD